MTVNIGLNLLPQFGARAAAPESDAAHRHMHLVKNREGIAQAEGDTLHDGAYHMSATMVGGQANERGAGMRIEVRSALAHEVWSPQDPVASRRNVPGFIRQALIGIAAVLCQGAEVVAEPTQRK